MNNAKSPQNPAYRLVWLVLILGVGAAFFLWPSEDAESLLEQGLASEIRDPAKSEQLIRRAIEARNGDFPDAQVALCCLLAKRGDWIAIRERFDSIDTSAVRSDLLMKFGKVSYESRQILLAAEALNAVWRRDDEHSETALSALISIYQEMGRQNDVIATLQEATSRNPRDFQRWRTLIEILQGSFLDVECLEAIQSALTHDPPPDVRLELQFRLVREFITLGDSEQAWREIAVLEDLEQQPVRLKALKVDLYRLDGKPDEALELATEIFPQLQHMPEAYMARGSIYLDLGEFEKASRDFQQLVDMRPHNARAHLKLADALRLSGRPEQALEHRQQGEQIRESRLRINTLLKEYSKTPKPEIREELAALFTKLEEHSAADFWKQSQTPR